MALVSISNQDQKALCARSARREDATRHVRFRPRRDRRRRSIPGRPSNSALLLFLRNARRYVGRRILSNTNMNRPIAALCWFPAQTPPLSLRSLSLDSGNESTLLLLQGAAHLS